MEAVQRPAPTNAAGFNTSSDDVFGRIASRYDLLCDLFSLYIHRRWKRRVAKLIAQEPWKEFLDVASGTGDIVLRVLGHRETHESRHVVVSDISPTMLAIAKRRLSHVAEAIELRCLDAHSLTGVPDNSIDLYSISLALKICDRMAVLREAMRVLRPGGRCCTGSLQHSLSVANGAYLAICGSACPSSDG